MAYNRKLLYTKSFPSWNTPEGDLGNVVNDQEMTPIQLVATELKEPGSTITYAVTSGSLPTGLTLSSSGEISGTPTGYTANETINFTITATDDEGEIAVRDFSVRVALEYEINYLVVAGGGGGGGQTGGGGGAGGFLEGSYALSLDNLLTITVGSGGAKCPAGTVNPSNVGTNGNDSSIISSILNVTSIGGGLGGTYQGDTINSVSSGNNGGSGGGGAALNSGTAGTGGLGTAGQGNNGAAGRTNYTATPYQGGGGGGAGSPGTTNLSSRGGDGGIGKISSITGTPTYYAGGGGGCGGGNGASSSLRTPGYGGTGGGANGGNDSAPALDAAANTGGGGGGGRDYQGLAGGASNGGSGVVILRMPTQSYSGTTTGSPTVTTDGSDTILTYTGSGTYTT